MVKPMRRNKYYKGGLTRHIDSISRSLEFEKEEVKIIPKTELEQKIAERLKWEGYVFQLPYYYEQSIQTIPVINEHGKWVQEKRVVKGPPCNLPSIKKFQITCSKKKLKERIKNAMRALQLPPNFKKQFPYLYAVLRDQVSAKVVEQSRGQYYMRLTSMYRELAQQFIAVMIEVFDMITNRMLTEVPELVAYFERHPEDMVLLNTMKLMIAPFTDPRLMKAETVLFIPEVNHDDRI